MRTIHPACPRLHPIQSRDLVALQPPCPAASPRASQPPPRMGTPAAAGHTPDDQPRRHEIPAHHLRRTNPPLDPGLRPPRLSLGDVRHPAAHRPLTETLPCDIAVEVHNFPERSREAVPRVLSITLWGIASSDTTNTDTDTSALLPLLEATIQAELAQTVPSQVQPLSLQVRRGSMRRSNTTTNSWWGENRSCELGLGVRPRTSPAARCP